MNELMTACFWMLGVSIGNFVCEFALFDGDWRHCLKETLFAGMNVFAFAAILFFKANHP